MAENVIDDNDEPYQKSEPIPAENRPIISLTEAISWMMFNDFENLAKCYNPFHINLNMTTQDFNTRENKAVRLFFNAAIEEKIILWGKQEIVIPKALKQIPTDFLRQGLSFFNPLNNEFVFGEFSNSYAWQGIEIKKAEFMKWWNKEPTNPANNPNHNSDTELAAKTRWQLAFDAVQKLINTKPPITQEEAIKKLFNDKHSSVQKIVKFDSYKAAYLQAVKKYKFNNS